MTSLHWDIFFFNLFYFWQHRVFCTWAFSCSSEQGSLSSCGRWATHSSGFSCEVRALKCVSFGSCGSWALKHRLNSCGAWA